MNIEEFVQKALNEDVGRGDLFSLVGQNIKAKAVIKSKEDGVVAGEIYVKKLCKILDIKCKFIKKDGNEVKNGEIIANFKGSSTTLLKAERTILNMLQHASGIATQTNRYVKILENSKTKILDTRKTRPHLRVFEKYAVRCGGGVNHRLGLDDCLMIKDTHLKTIKNLKTLIKKARIVMPFTSKIEVESENFAMAVEAMESGADIVMCDNMSIKEMKKVVKYRDENFPMLLIEASGNIEEDRIKAISEIKIDAISSGSLIHQAKWIDFSMKFQ